MFSVVLELIWSGLKLSFTNSPFSNMFEWNMSMLLCFLQAPFFIVSACLSQCPCRICMVIEVITASRQLLSLSLSIHPPRVDGKLLGVILETSYSSLQHLFTAIFHSIFVIFHQIPCNTLHVYSSRVGVVNIKCSFSAACFAFPNTGFTL